MWVTLYADASWNEKLGVGGYAIWAKSAEGRLVHRGDCPPYVRNSTDCELAAIYAGVWYVLRQWPSTRGILVCSDSQGALLLLDFRSPAKGEGSQRLQGLLRDLVGPRSVTLEGRWVRGHQGAQRSTQAYLNHQVDRLASVKRFGHAKVGGGAKASVEAVLAEGKAAASKPQQAGRRAAPGEAKRRAGTSTSAGPKSGAPKRPSTPKRRGKGKRKGAKRAWWLR